MPGYIGVEGNERANKVAKAVTEMRDILGFPQRFISLTHIGRTVTERK